MKKGLILILLLFVFSFSFHVYGANTNITVSGYWSSEIWDVSNLDGSDVIVIKFEATVPDGASYFEMFAKYTSNEDLYISELIAYSYYIPFSATTITEQGAYWINYADDDVIGEQTITDASSLATYTEDDMLHFEYNLATLVDWTSDYTFVMTYAIDFDSVPDYAKYLLNATEYAEILKDSEQLNLDAYYTIDTSYNYYTLQFYDVDNITVIYTQTYSDSVGVYDLDIEDVPNVTPNVYYTIVATQNGWSYANGDRFDPEDVDVTKAVNSIIKLYPRWTYTDFQTEGSGDLTTDETIAQTWFTTLMSGIHFTTATSFMFIFVLGSIFLIVAIAITKMQVLRGIMAVIMFIWLIFATWVGMVPLFVTAIVGLLELVLIFNLMSQGEEI